MPKSRSNAMHMKSFCWSSFSWFLPTCSMIELKRSIYFCCFHLKICCSVILWIALWTDREKKKWVIEREFIFDRKHSIDDWKWSTNRTKQIKGAKRKNSKIIIILGRFSWMKQQYEVSENVRKKHDIGFSSYFFFLCSSQAIFRPSFYLIWFDLFELCSSKDL